MCGRYTYLFTWQELHDLMTLSVPSLELTFNYNMAPSQLAPVIRESEACLMRWGLIPAWSKDPSISYKLINARAETITQKPSYRTAFRSHRCLVPVSGFYEWLPIKGKKQKQPYYIFNGTSVLVFAGLWEQWISPEGSNIESFTIVTTAANETISELHNRMPLILDPEAWGIWLGQDTSPAELDSILKSTPTKDLEYYPVSTLVNSPKNNSPECIKSTSSIYKSLE